MSKIDPETAEIWSFWKFLGAPSSVVDLCTGPFQGRVKDWHAANGGADVYEPSDDPGVVSASASLHAHRSAAKSPPPSAQTPRAAAQMLPR